MWFYFNNDSGTINKTFRNFSVANIATVNKIVLTKNNTRIELAENTSGNWLVNDTYPANNNQLKFLLFVLKNVDVKSPVSRLMNDSIIDGLVSDGIKCEIYQNNELSKLVYVGAKPARQGGTYMVLADLKTLQPFPVSFVTHIPGVDEDLYASYPVDEKVWREHVVFNYSSENIQSVSMEVPLYPEAGYELSLGNDFMFQLKGLSSQQQIDNIDAVAVKQYLSYFEGLNFESFEAGLTATQKQLLLKSAPLNIITVADKAGKVNKVQFYPLNNTKNIFGKDGKPLKFDPERMLALLNNGKDLVVVKFFEFGKVMPPANYFQLK